MTKKDKFVLMVQTGAIVDDITRGRRIAARVLQEALEIPEKVIPEDFGDAALQFINYCYDTSDCGPRPPDWLPQIKV